jgi:hypothetical protein
MQRPLFAMEQGCEDAFAMVVDSPAPRLDPIVADTARPGTATPLRLAGGRLLPNACHMKPRVPADLGLGSSYSAPGTACTRFFATVSGPTATVLCD